MSNFFRDSNFFQPRNNKLLFGNPNPQNGTGGGKSIHSAKESRLLNLNSNGEILKFGNRHDIPENEIKEDDMDTSTEDESIEANQSRPYTRDTAELEDHDDENNAQSVPNMRSNSENEEDEEDEVNDDDDDDDDDDDIKIMEVRDVTHDQVDTSDTLNYVSIPKQEDQTTVMQTAVSCPQGDVKDVSQSSDNVSLQYLLNTIAHLSEKNKSLEAQMKEIKTENDSVTQALAQKAESVENLKLHVVKLRNGVSSYNNIFVDLKTRFKELNNSRQMLVTEIQSTKLSIAKENEKVRSLQKIMTSMKNQIATDQTTISQKSEKIETLKNKANELAGRLSEEKIKNSELTKLLSEASSKYEGDLYTIAKQNCESIKAIIATELKNETSAKESTKQIKEELLRLDLANTEFINLLKNGVNEGFNDIAIRVTGLATSNDCIKSCISDSNSKLIEYKNAIISALSTVDKNLTSSLASNLNTLISKVSENSTKVELQACADKIFNAVCETLSNETTIREIQKANGKLVSDKCKLENTSTMQSINLKNKENELNITRTQLHELKSKLESIDSSIANERVTHSEKMAAMSAELKAKGVEFDDLKNEYETQIKHANEKNKMVEEQNIKLFNEEKKKVATLSKEISSLERGIDSLKHLEEANKVMGIQLATAENNIKEAACKLENLKGVQSESNQRNLELQRQLESAKCNVERLTEEVRCLKKTLEENEVIAKDCISSKDKEIKRYAQEMSSIKFLMGTLKEKHFEEFKKLQLEKDHGPTNKDEGFENSIPTATLNPEPESEEQSPNKIGEPLDFFPKSRTSTTLNEDKKIRVKQEKAGKPVTKLNRVTKPRSKRKDSKAAQSLKRVGDECLIPPSLKTKAAAAPKPRNAIQSKRKLISSSQDSLKNATASETKAKPLNKHLLHELDIFNEFEAIERLGTLNKPAW